MTEQNFPSDAGQENIPLVNYPHDLATNDPGLELIAVQQYIARLFHYTPITYLTWLLIACNVGIFVLMVLRGVSAINPTPDELVRWGANIGMLTRQGEWWRLFSCMFLHFGIIHIGFNMFVLWQIGPLTERLLGRAGFLVTYLLAGLVGSFASLYWNPSNVASAGASGAIFGLCGALLGLMWRGHRDGTIPISLIQQQVKAGLIFIGINFAYGLTQRNIDMSAHLGGLIGGFLCGLALAHPLTPAGVAGRWSRALLLTLLGGALLIGAIVMMPRTNDYAGFRIIFLRDVEPQVTKTFYTAATRAEAGQIIEKQFADIIEHDVLPRWRASQHDYHQLNNRVPTKDKQEYTLLGQYIDKRAEWWSMLIIAYRTGDKGEALRAKTAQEQGDAAITALNKLYKKK